MLEHFGMNVTFSLKEGKSVVTEADTTINDLALRELSKHFPGYSFIGEEGSNIVEGSTFSWLCDPIDGTYPFTLGLPLSVFSLVLLDDGQPVVAVVYDPYQKRMYTAKKGEGAFLSEKHKLEVSNENLGEQDVFVEWWKGNSEVYNGADVSREFEKRGSCVTQLMSAIHEGMLVAAGKFAAQVFPGSCHWDKAAVKLIVEEAGGRVTDLKGNDMRYDEKSFGMIATNGKVHDEVVGMVEKHLLES